MEENAKKKDSKLQKKLKKLTNPSSPEIWNVFVKNVEKIFNIFL